MVTVEPIQQSETPPKSQRFRRRGFRMMVAASILAPILLVVLAFSGLAVGFCGDRISSEVDSCEAGARGQVRIVIVLLVCAVALFLVGLGYRIRGSRLNWQEESGTTSTPTSDSGRPNRHAQWSFGLGISTLLVMAWTTQLEAFAQFFLGIAGLILGPVAALLGWRSLDRRGADATARRDRSFAIVGIAAGVIAGAIAIALNWP